MRSSMLCRQETLILLIIIQFLQPERTIYPESEDNLHETTGPVFHEIVLLVKIPKIEHRKVCHKKIVVT